MSLRRSRIYQDFISVGTFTGEGTQALLGDQVDTQLEHVLQVKVHAAKFEKPNALLKHYQNIDIGVLALFSSLVGAEDPCLQHGLGLEIFGCLAGYRLSVCHITIILSTANIRIISDGSSQNSVDFATRESTKTRNIL